MSNHTIDITISYWESDQYMDQQMTVYKDELTKYLRGFDKYLVGKFDDKLVAIRTDFIVWLRED